MIHNEQRLVSRIILDKDISPLVERGIVPEWFGVERHRDVATWIYAYHSKYGAVPSQTALHGHFPAYELCDEEGLDVIEALCDSLIARRRYWITSKATGTAATLVGNGDVDAAAAVLREAVSDLDHSSGTITNDLVLTQDTQRRFDWYEQIHAAPGGILGLPCGFPTIDRATGGFQGEQLITLIASPKTGKTWTALQVAINVHSLSGRAPSVMFLSFEMSVRELQVRHDALRAHLPYPLLRRGGMSKAQQRTYREMLTGMEGLSNDFILTDSAEGSTLSQLAAKIEDLNCPDLIVVDGIYLMVDEISGEMSTQKSMTNISRGLKKLAQRIRRPILITTQALTWKMHGTKLSANSVGYSSSVTQDSDVIIGLERDEDTSVTDARVLRILESRNSPPVDTRLVFDIGAGIIREAEQIRHDLDDEDEEEPPW